MGFVKRKNTSAAFSIFDPFETEGCPFGFPLLGESGYLPGCEVEAGSGQISASANLMFTRGFSQNLLSSTEKLTLALKGRAPAMQRKKKKKRKRREKTCCLLWKECLPSEMPLAKAAVFAPSDPLHPAKPGV